MTNSNPRADIPTIAEGLFSFDIGGSERVGADLAVEFAARGYRVICFAFYATHGPIKSELEARGVECVDLNYSIRPRLTRRITYQWDFFRFLRRNNIRALHVHHATALTLCGVAAKVAGVQNVVMTEHALHQLKDRPRYRAQARRDCRYATHISAVHAGISDYFRDELGVLDERLHVIGNGVRIAKRREVTCTTMRRSLAIADETFVFLFAGRLEAVKDLSTLLNAVAALPDPVRACVRLLIAGDGSQRRSLEAQSVDLNLNTTVSFLGARTDVTDLLEAADAFVMSSVTEGLPMALIEAMAADVPCIATAVGGIPELFANDTGLLVPPSNPDALSKMMYRVITEPETRSLLSKRGALKVRDLYDLNPIVDQYLSLLGLPPHWPK